MQAAEAQAVLAQFLEEYEGKRVPGESTPLARRGVLRYIQQCL